LLTRNHQGKTSHIALPPNFDPGLPPKDEPDEIEFDHDDVIGAAFAMRYMDTKGVESARRITVRRVTFDANQKIILGAYCHERKGYRAFRADRIKELIDVRTGEVIGDLVATFQHLAMATGPETALHLCRHELQVLAFVGLCDGHFDELEQDHAAMYVGARYPDIAPDHDDVLAHVRTLHPDSDSFYKSLNALSRPAAGDLALFLRTLRRLVNADGHIHENEMEVLIAIDDAPMQAAKPRRTTH